MKLGQTYFSGSITFDEGNNFIGPDTSILTGSFTGSVAGVFEGDFTGASSTAISGAFTSTSESIATDISTNSASIASLEAASGSYLLNTTDTLSGSLTVTGEVIAQTLHVQQVTSSIVYSSGSNIFGETVSDTQKITGSLQVSGSTHHLFGSVGIGTDSPSAKLHVNGGAVSTPRGGGFTKFFFTGDNATTTYLELQTPSGSTGDILFSDGSSGDYGIVGYNHANDSMYFYTNSSPRMTIGSSGNVAIGGDITSYANYRYLTITGGSTSQGGVVYLKTSDSSVAGEMYVETAGMYISSATSGKPMYLRTGGSDRLTILSGGNVGINETSPDAKLHVTGKASYTTANSSEVSGLGFIRLQPNSDSEHSLWIHNAANNLGISGYTDAATTSVRDITLQTFGGNVGIGETNPIRKLHVDGGSISEDTPTVRISSTDSSGTNKFGIEFYSKTGADVRGKIFADNNGRVYIDDNGGGGVVLQTNGGTGGVSIGSTSSNSRKFRVYGSGDLVDITSTNTGVGGAQIDLRHESSSPADGDNVGIINFNGLDSGLNGTQYANIKAVASSTSSETGELHFGTRKNSSTYNGSNVVIDSDGNVGIGQTSPSDKLSIANSTGDAGILLQGPSQTLRIDQNSIRTTTESSINIFTNNSSGTNSLYIGNDGRFGVGTASPTAGTKLDVNGKVRAVDDLILAQTNPRIDYDGGTTGALRFFSTSANLEKMRLKSEGYLKVSSDGTYFNVNDSYHEFISDANNWTTLVGNTDASPFGILVEYSNNPNGSGNFPFYFNVQNVGKKIAFRSDGGLENIQSNDVNLSDIRVKRDIALLDSYWDKFKALEVVTFKYIDQSHDNDNIGFIAQQVETVAPEFISDEGWQQDAFDNEEEPLKAIYTADMYNAAIKVLQEAMAKIEVLEAKVAALEGQ